MKSSFLFSLLTLMSIVAMAQTSPIRLVSGMAERIGYNVTLPNSWTPHETATPITLDTLRMSHTLGDLYKWYRPNWVNTYYSVEIAAQHANETIKSKGASDVLTDDQIAIVEQVGKEGGIVDVAVHYLPENTLVSNIPRWMNFSLNIYPIYSAVFPGGREELSKYFEANVIDKVAADELQHIELVTIQFHIDEKGFISKSTISQTSSVETIDRILIDAINKMPTWEPAKDASGKVVEQILEFNLGRSMLGC